MLCCGPPSAWNKPQLLGTLGGAGSDAEGITDHGKIVGSAQLKNGHYHPVIWTIRDGSIQDLGTLGDGGGAGFAISQNGFVAGVSGTVAHPDEPFWRSPSGLMIDLLPHHIYVGGTAAAVSAAQNVAGWVNTATNTYPAFWRPFSSVMQLPTLGGANGSRPGSTSRIRWSDTPTQAAPLTRSSGPIQVESPT